MGLLDLIFGGQAPQQQPPPSAPQQGLPYDPTSFQAILGGGLSASRPGSLFHLLGGFIDPAGRAATAQQLQAADLANRLNQINVRYYEGAQQPTANPTAGLLAPQAAPAGLLGGPATQQAPSGGSPGAGPQAPGGGGFLLDPTTVLGVAQRAMGVPALKDAATQYLKLYEQMINSGRGATTAGGIAPFAGAPETEMTMKHAGSLGETLAKNNQTQTVAPGGALIQGPRTLPEYAGSVAGGGTRPSYINPMSPALVNVNTGGAGSFWETFGKELGGGAGEVIKGGGTAAQQLQYTGAARDMVNAWRQAGGTQGWTAPLQARFAAGMQGLGLNPEALGLPTDAGPAQVLDSITKKLALGNIGAGGLPANNFSEADRNYINDIQPNIKDTPSGYEAKLLIAEKLAQRSLEAQQSMLGAVQGVPPQQAASAYAQWKAKWDATLSMRPIFTPQDRARIKALATMSQQEPAAPASQPRAAPQIDPDAAKAELRRRGVIQ